jgi:hypothetical protein
MRGPNDETTIPGRQELKYCVSESVASRVLDVARGYLVQEPLASGPRQRVTSLYLDTPTLTFLRWHREGVADRYKLRIRYYGEPPAGTVYTEVKRKTASVVRKQREAFPAEALETLAQRFLVRYGAAPRTLVRGIRESLRDPGEETAVTVDRALQYQLTRRVDLVGDDAGWAPLSLPRCSGHSPSSSRSAYGERPPRWMDALIRTRSRRRACPFQLTSRR